VLKEYMHTTIGHVRLKRIKSHLVARRTNAFDIAALRVYLSVPQRGVGDQQPRPGLKKCMSYLTHLVAEPPLKHIIVNLDHHPNRVENKTPLKPPSSTEQKTNNCHFLIVI